MENPYEKSGWQHQEAMHPGGITLTQELLERVPLDKDSKVLDVGCGHGGTVHYLLSRGIEAVGIDPSLKLIEEAKREGNPKAFMVGDLGKLPFPNNYFTAILAECTLSIIEDREIGFNEIFRVLKRDGFLIISDLFWDKDSLEEERLWGLLSWLHPLEEMGFEVVELKNQEEVFRDFCKEAIWNGNRELIESCIPRGKGSDIGYFSLILQKRR